MSGSFFPMIARMRYINRWGLMRNTDVENIQEHSHMVAVLAHALAVIQNRYFGPQIDPGQAAVAALYHDASEILTGDMPTPITSQHQISLPGARCSRRSSSAVAASLSRPWRRARSGRLSTASQGRTYSGSMSSGA